MGSRSAYAGPMALLEQTDTGTRVSLGARCLVGRSRACALQLEDRTVSGEHAVFFYGLNGVWVLRDLGSRNGTWLDGRRLPATEPVELRRGQRIRFGGANNDWLLVDDSPPGLIAQGPDGQRREMVEGLLVLPDEDAPLVWILRVGEGWSVERGEGGGAVLVEDGQDLDVGGSVWTLHLPKGQSLDTAVPTQGASLTTPLGDIGLELVTDRQGQLLRLAWTCPGERQTLPVRAFHGVVLELARLRIRDQQRGLPELECGWTHADDLLARLGVSPQKLHVDLLRCRRQLAASGVEDADELFERRLASRELRLGVGRLRLLSSDEAEPA